MPSIRKATLRRPAANRIGSASRCGSTFILPARTRSVSKLFQVRLCWSRTRATTRRPQPLLRKSRRSSKTTENMESLDGLLRKAEATHGHLCAGQILGVQLALLGLIRLGTTDEPRGRRELQIQMKPQAVRMR